MREVLARSDALGPFELVLELRDGNRRKLSRIYSDWQDLVGDITRR